MTRYLACFSCLTALMTVGCGSSPDATTATQQRPIAAPNPAPDLRIDTSASGITGEVSDKDLAKYRLAYETAKKAHERKGTPTSTDDYLIATTTYGTGTMLAGSLGAKEKYRGAIALYREAGKLPATGDKAKKFAAEAKKNEGVIVSIYKMMGRPVPQ